MIRFCLLAICSRVEKLFDVLLGVNQAILSR